MMLTRFVRFFLLLNTMLILSVSNAQAEDEIPPNYTLEVIVFQTFALKSWTEEYWPETLNDLDYDNSVFLSDLLTLNAPKRAQNYQSQPIELKDVAAKLSPKKGYKILFHQAWSQNTTNSDTMPTLMIETAQGSSELSGTIKLYKSRYAHAEFDLRLTRLIPNKIKADFMQQQGFETEAEWAEYWEFALTEKRKVRPNQLHYLDHPHFGVLVQLRYNGPADQQ